MKIPLNKSLLLSLPSLMIVVLVLSSLVFAQSEPDAKKETGTSAPAAKAPEGDPNKVMADVSPAGHDAAAPKEKGAGEAGGGKSAKKAEVNPVTEMMNHDMPGWLRWSGEYRMRFENKSRPNGVPGNNDGYFSQRLRIAMTIKPTENWTMYVEGQDSHVFGYNVQPPPSSFDDNLDLRQAYVDYTSGAKRGWGVRVGRQEFKYTDQRVIGVSNWSNTSRVFDAIKLSAFGEKYAVDVFASSVVVNQDQVFNKHVDGQNLYGAHATFPTLIPKGEVNVYSYWRTRPIVTGETVRTGLRNSGDSDTVTTGTRFAGKLPKRFDYITEIMLQRGSFANDSVHAYAFHSRLGYLITANHWAPKLLLEYNQGSGDKNPRDGVRGTYDQLFPDNHGKYGIHDIVSIQNLQNLRLGIGLAPTKKLKVDFDYHNFWLTQTRDGVYNEQGTRIAFDPTGMSGNHVSQETDLQIVYSMKSYVSLGAVYGYWFPGQYWKNTTGGAPGSSFFSYVTYKF